MPKLDYQLNPGHVAFPPITTMEVTVGNHAAWRTVQRTPLHYGVKGIASVPMNPTSEGPDVVARRQLQSQANPQLVYLLGGNQYE